ncbi:MAG: MFS transporter [Actinomycetales bacterium]|nr:MFS transporter [Actinomycetales bacterium]
MTSAEITKANKRATFAWALWDWAEQPYPTIMQTFVFPTYLASAVAAEGSHVDAQIGVATAIAGFLLAITAPVVGRRSDETGRRKFWLVVNTYLLVAIMAVSFFIEPKPEFLLGGLVLYALGSVIQESAFINYYAMLKSVTTEKNIGKISGYAWGLGYVGGILLLVVTLFGFIKPIFGEPLPDGLGVRLTFVFAAVWTAVFTLPLVFRVPEIAAKPGYQKESIAQSYRSLWKQLSTLRRQAPETFKFLISSAIYRDGLAGVFTFGAVLGTLAFGFSQSQVIIFGIAANIFAGLGAGLGGWLDDKLGSRTVILGSLIGLIIAGTGLFIAAPMGQSAYWIFGLILCLFVGPAQASSRTFVSRFTPAGREGEVFGLYQTTGRAVSFLSGTLWTVSISVAHTAFGVQDATIWGIWGLMLILGVGAWLLSRVHPRPAVIDSAD